MASDLARDQSRATSEEPKAILVAVPSALDSDGIDVFQLPHEARVHTIPSDRSVKTGETNPLRANKSNSGLSTPLGHMHGTLAIQTIVRIL
ncbi:MAG: hypothetical protein M1840_000677 [Geoglossum simile]|nr:MAG: hypothetical protein M1840_000677 [Geoglossum simile]